MPRDRFDDEACRLKGCTITDKTGPCPMFGCRMVARSLRVAHLEGRMEATGDIALVVKQQTKRTAVFLILRAQMGLAEEVKAERSKLL